MAESSETRAIYDALQEINIPDKDLWSSNGADVDQWCEFENSRREEESQIITETSDELPSVPLINLTSQHFLTNRSDSVTAEAVYYVQAMPEYPETSIGGILYCISVGGLQSELVKKLHETVQYGHDCTDKPNNAPTSSIFLKKPTDSKGVPVRRTIYKCSGIYCCEYSVAAVQHPHTSWTIKDWEKRQADISSAEQAFMEEWNPWIGQEATLTVYHTMRKLYTSPTSRFRCKGRTQCDGKIVVILKDIATFSSPNIYVQCSRITKPEDEKLHFHLPIANKEEINVQYLKSLFEAGFQGQKADCFIILHPQTRKKNCGIAHPQGYGKLQKISCDVKFEFIIPQDLEQTPYVLFYSKGIHYHQPPPPIKTPVQILDGLVKVIRRLSSPVMTNSTLLVSNDLKLWLKELGKQSLGQLHASLSNRSRISALIKADQLLNWPAGRNWAGVVFEKEHEETPYIQYLYNDGTNCLAICFFSEAIEYLKEAVSIQMDLSFKRIFGEMNEFLFVDWVKQGELVTSFGRCFMNSDSRQAYFELFKAYFGLVNDFLKHENQFLAWHHIHGFGIKAVVTDMCSKQASGFGDYLSLVHGNRFPWQWHVQKILIYCTVHFQRGIDTGKYKQTAVGSLMKEIISAKTAKETLELVAILQVKHPDLKEWLDHKTRPWILSGLNINFWKGDKEIFTTIQRSSNLVEATHHQSNSLGTRLSLVGGIYAGREIDRRSLDAIVNRSKFGIQVQHKNRSALQRYEDRFHSFNRKRNIQKRRFAEAVERATANAIDDPNIIGSRFNSSGKPKRQKKSNTAQQEPKQLNALEKAREEAEIQKIMAESEQLRLQNELQVLELERQRRVLGL